MTIDLDEKTLINILGIVAHSESADPTSNKLPLTNALRVAIRTARGEKCS